GQPGSPIANLPLMTTLVTDVQDGSLTLNSDGSFSYKPNANFVGVDTFTYRASLANTPPTTGNGDPTATAGTANIVCPPKAMSATPLSDVATVRIYVKAPEPPPGPVAVNDYYLTAENTTLGIGMPG